MTRRINMTKLLYLAAMALLGLGLTMAQNSSPPSDASNSSHSAQTQQNTTPGTANSQNSTEYNPSQSQQRGAGHHRQQKGVPDTTIHDQQGSTTSTTGPAGENNTASPNSRMGTTGSTPTPDTEPANPGASTPQGGTPTDQQPNASSPPSTQNPHLVMKDTPGARAMATHTPDPGTCMNPVAVDSGQGQGTVKPGPNCD